MKKYLIFVFMFFLLVGQVHAHGVPSESLINRFDGWTPMQIGIFPFFLFQNDIKVCGLNFNGLFNYNTGDVYGISIAPFHINGLGMSYGLTAGIGAAIDKAHTGLLICVYSKIEKNDGLQIGILNFSEKSDYKDIRNGGGIQLGIFNQTESGVQIGLLNYNSNAYIPWMIICNWSPRDDQQKTSKSDLHEGMVPVVVVVSE